MPIMYAKQFRDESSSCQNYGAVTVDIDTRKLSFNAFIKPHIDYASVVWGSRSDVVGKKDYILCTEKLSN